MQRTVIINVLQLCAHDLLCAMDGILRLTLSNRNRQQGDILKCSNRACIMYVLYVCIIIYMCVYLLCTHVCTCMHTCMHTCLYVCRHMSVCMCVYVCIYAYMSVCIHTHMYVCVHVCIHVCMYAYIDGFFMPYQQNRPYSRQEVFVFIQPAPLHRK